jgi:hypothetical protein
MKYPLTISFGTKMMERWRFNQQKRSGDRETIGLFTLLDAAGHRETFLKRVKKIGWRQERGAVSREKELMADWLERQLDALEESFGIDWCWAEDTPEKPTDLEKAMISYRVNWWEVKTKSSK